MAAVVDVDPYRPIHHFSPKHGWMNDPNGLIRVDGVWHAFFQYYPDGTTHGPMHWGHATTRDLVTWTEQPIALYPDSNGTCFSGSAIETPAGDVELFYTAHSVDAAGNDHQTQCIAHASRDMASFSTDTANPIIPNPGLRAFRDPKVIWHGATSRWIMVLTHGQSIGIYSSEDRRGWSLESTFGDVDGCHSNGPWECPDLLELRGPDHRSYWVLIVGIGDGAFGGGSGTQYFVGEFDGHQFRNLNAPEVALWLDYGRDFYAAQSFFEQGSQTPLVLAWASNWQYARQTPTKAFRGVFSLPRRLRLLSSPGGFRLAATVPQEVAARFKPVGATEENEAPLTGSYRLTRRMKSTGTMLVSLFGAPAPQLVIERHGDGKVTLTLHRSSPHSIDHFDHDYSITADIANGEMEVDVFVDNGLVEVSIGGGVLWATSLYFPQHPAGRVQVSCRN